MREWKMSHQASVIEFHLELNDLQRASRHQRVSNVDGVGLITCVWDAIGQSANHKSPDRRSYFNFTNLKGLERHTTRQRCTTRRCPFHWKRGRSFLEHQTTITLSMLVLRAKKIDNK